jgi:hypothetical protein
MPECATERDMFDLMAQKLATSVISDILDALGFRDQVMRTTIRPLFSETVVVGRAMLALYAEVFEVAEKPTRKNFTKAPCCARHMRSRGCCEPCSSEARSTVNKIADADGTKRSRDVCWPSR